MYELYIKQLFTDVTINLADAKISAHKVFLYKNDWFKTRFETEIGTQSEIDLTNISVKSFNIILKYYYGEKIKLDIDMDVNEYVQLFFDAKFLLATDAINEPCFFYWIFNHAEIFKIAPEIEVEHIKNMKLLKHNCNVSDFLYMADGSNIELSPKNEYDIYNIRDYSIINQLIKKYNFDDDSHMAIIIDILNTGCNEMINSLYKLFLTDYFAGKTYSHIDTILSKICNGKEQYYNMYDNKYLFCNEKKMLKNIDSTPNYIVTSINPLCMYVKKHISLKKVNIENITRLTELFFSYIDDDNNIVTRTIKFMNDIDENNITTLRLNLNTYFCVGSYINICNYILKIISIEGHFGKNQYDNECTLCTANVKFTAFDSSLPISSYDPKIIVYNPIQLMEKNN